MKKMLRKIIATPVILLLLTLHSAAVRADNEANPAQIDTTIRIDRVQVTAIKQGLTLRHQPVAASVLGREGIARQHIDALKDVSQVAPNFYAPDYGSRMTSSIYVRGLGARIDQPVVGLNIDNVPILNKDNYDFDLSDAARIEVLRGPQSTLYGRNTMGGVINIYTLSPLDYQGVRLGMEYGSGDTWKFRAASYYKIAPNLGMSVAANYTRSAGFFENLYTGEKCDWERSGGGRFKLQWRNGRGLSIDNTFAFSVLEQGGYPYASVATGEINYNSPSSYDRTTVTDGLTIRYDAHNYSLSSITSYQYSDDAMLLDQDFLPASYFTLRQARRSHAVTEDVVIRSREDKAYQWLFGVFGFYRHDRMDAPVNFLKDGIEQLILANANEHDPEYNYTWHEDELLLTSNFRNPTLGAALYHESNYTLGRWRFTAGIRIDYEQSRLSYKNNLDAGYTKTHRENGKEYPLMLHLDIGDRLKQSFTEWLPKFAVLYRFNSNNSLYASVSKGYKAGGFNTQMFSDVLQQRMMQQMGFGTAYDVKKVVTYKPEKSWNYEIGGHLTAAQGALRGDFALFWIDCSDQQLTVFPDGTTTGRMMTNAGRTRSLGGEGSMQATLWERLDLGAAYGYTHATFRNYKPGLRDAAGAEIDYRGNRIPYAPQHTLSATADYTIPVQTQWLESIRLHAGIRGAGRIWWNEENTLSQPFYTLLNASICLQHKNYSLELWGRNLASTSYDTFYFMSIGNAFLQQGRPRTFGATLTINL